MTNLVVVFLTGLTTGGLSCLAVQGGLLASSVAQQAEQNVQKQFQARQAVRPAAKKHKPSPRQPLAPATAITGKPPSLVWPIVLFLGAKLVVYTFLGFLLGWLGSMLQLTPFMRAILQLAIGVFMLGTALRMLNVHPIFRYFALEPPAVVTRYIRRTAKGDAHAMITSLFLGALTVLIPCGVTQAMMALAIGTGNSLEGAAIMFAFTLGASPIFFGLAYLTTQLGQKLEARFIQIVGLIVFVLGLVSIDGGLTLLGAPFTVSRAVNMRALAPNILPQASTSFATLTPATQPQPAAAAQPASPTLIQPTVAPAQAQETPFFNPSIVGPQSLPNQPAGGDTQPAGAANVVNINVLDYGYDPLTSRALAGQPVQLNLTTHNIYGCTLAFVVPTLNLFQVLPTTGVTTLKLSPQPEGAVLYYTCSMGMFGGQINFN